MVVIAVLLALIAIVVAAFTVLPILVSAAQGVEVRVNAPESVSYWRYTRDKTLVKGGKKYVSYTRI